MKKEEKADAQGEQIPVQHDQSGTGQAGRDWSVLNSSLQYVNANHEIPYYWDFGPAGIKTFIKRTVRRFIKCMAVPILDKQNQFNAHVVRCLNHIRYGMNEMFHRTDVQAKQIALLKKELSSCREEIRVLRQKTDSLDRQSDAFSASVAKMLVKYRRNEVVTVVQEDTGEQRQQVKTAANENVYTVLDYFKFQNDFRGARSVISERQKMYLPYFQDCAGPVIDIGCGRGEFLQLMKDNQIPAFGVDLYPEYEVEGELNGLDIRQGNGIEFLKNSDQQFGGIFAAQVIEHISFTELQELCAAAYEKLVPGAFLVLETPNPTCLSVFASAFYKDPTHNKPVHPQLLQYVLREVGFSDVQLVFTEASRLNAPLPLIKSDAIQNLQEVNRAITRVSNLLYGSLDYAVIARK